MEQICPTTNTGIKTIEINDSGVKMPIISIGDDVSLLCSIIAEDNTSIITNSKRLNQFDDLFYSYATNNKTQKAPRKTSKSLAEEEIMNKINSK